MITRISQSRVKDWRRCHKLHDYKWNQHLKRRMPSRPLYTGTIIHEMLDAFSKDLDPWKVLKRHEKAVKKFIREEPETYEDLIPNIRTIFKNYLAHYEDDGLVYEESELELLLDLGNDLELVIHIDKVVSDQKKRLWIMDHKCHKNIPTEDKRLADLQLVVYPTVWDKRFPKRKVTGVVWDYIRTKVPAIPETLKNGELSKRKNIDTTYETYLTEIERLNLNPEDYQDMLDMLKGQVNSFYERPFLPVANDAMVKNIWDDLINTGKEIQEYGPTLMDRNLRWDCDMCQFKELCMAELRGLDSTFVRKSRYIMEEPDVSQEEVDN